MKRRSFLRASAFALAATAAGMGMPPLFMAKEARARGATPEEYAKARQIFTNLAASGQGQSVRPEGSAFTIAPGEVLTFENQGYCLDPELAFPSEGEPLAFRPMSKYIAPTLRELYVKLMRNAGQGGAKDVDVQKIVWRIRSSEEYIDTIKDRERRYIEKVMPGGVSLMATTKRPPQYLSGYDTGGEWQLNLWAKKPMPGPEQSYSMLTSAGVAGKAVGLGMLDMRVSVANASPNPFVFDPVQWVLESSRDIQAVALPAAPKAVLVKGRPPACVKEQPPSAATKNSAGPDAIQDQIPEQVPNKRAPKPGKHVYY